MEDSWFWWECIDGQKNQLDCFLGPFLIQPIILFLFVLIFLLSEWIWSENAVGGSLACQICPLLAKNSVRYYNTITNNLLCAPEQKEKIPNCRRASPRAAAASTAALLLPRQSCHCHCLCNVPAPLLSQHALDLLANLKETRKVK